MKLDLVLHVTEDEISSAIAHKVRTAIADQTNTFATDNYIREQVKANWKAAVDGLIAEALFDSPVLREKIMTEMEKKLRAQLAAALKGASK